MAVWISAQTKREAGQAPCVIDRRCPRAGGRGR